MSLVLLQALPATAREHRSQVVIQGGLLGGILGRPRGADGGWSLPATLHHQPWLGVAATQRVPDWTAGEVVPADQHDQPRRECKEGKIGTLRPCGTGQAEHGCCCLQICCACFECRTGQTKTSGCSLQTCSAWWHHFGHVTFSRICVFQWNSEKTNTVEFWDNFFNPLSAREGKYTSVCLCWKLQGS